MKLWSICFLIIFPILIYAQNEDYANSGSDTYDDPLRRTLGLLGRIMNRMAQPGPPTDEQLHFTVNDPPDMKALSDLIRQQRKKPLSKTDRIINEELLQRLIPRVKGQTLPPRTPPTTTTKVPKTTTTTTVATTTTVTTTTTSPTTTTEATTTSAPTTGTTEPSTTVSTTSPTKKDKSLIVRVKSVDELQKSLEASAELNDEDSRNAQIVAEALRILLKEEGMNATKATEKLREIANAAFGKITKNKSTKAPTTTSTTTTSTVAPTTTETEAPKVLKEEKIVQEADEESEAISEEEEEEEAEVEEPSEGEVSRAKTSPVAFKQAPARIPEAEEEEQLSTKSQEKVEVSFQETGTTTTTRAPLSGQTVYNLNANANSASDPAISNVFTPVNAIVDGIGPLILPLIGYSRQALQYYPRAQGANTYQPDNGKPVQLRSLPKGYGFGSGQEQQQQQQQAYARGTPIQQQQTLSSLKTATTDQLIEAFHRASKANSAPSSQPRPYSRYVPNPSSVNSYFTQGGGDNQQNLEQLRKAFIQSNQQPSYNLRQPQEIIGTTLSTEPTYYGPQIDRHIGQNLFTQGVRHREEPQKTALPVDTNPDPAYAEGLKKVNAFVGDSGVMAGDESAPTYLEESGLPPTKKPLSGFGGGKGPNASFDEVVKNTEQEPSYNFLG